MASTYWIKLYHEILHDPKMCRLSDHLYRRCIELFLQAGESDKDGELPSIDDMAWTFRTENDLLLDDLQALAAIGIVHEAEGKWIVTNFAERQDPDNPAERVARHRERKRKAEYYVTNPKPQEPQPQTEFVTESVTPVEQECNESLQESQQNVTQIRLDEIRLDKIRSDSESQHSVTPRPSTRIREPVPINAALQAYFDVMQVRPNREQALVITKTITPSNIDKWKNVLRAWKLHDYKPGNVPGMLEWYETGIPTNGGGKARAAPVTQAVQSGEEMIRLNHLGRESEYEREIGASGGVQ
jgi:hypothetical protein